MIRNTRTQQEIYFKHGFTLLELIIVMGIVALLISITLSAVISSRSAARSLGCKNNLKNIGMGLIQFESVNLRFPGIYSGLVKRNGTITFESFSPSSLIAGFVDSNALADSMQYVQPLNEQDPDWTSLHLDAPAIFHCPEDTASERAASSYRYCRGVLPLWPEDPGGVFVRRDQGFSAAEITDGLSSTAFASERLVSIPGRNKTGSSFVIVNKNNGMSMASACIAANEGNPDLIQVAQMTSGTAWMSGRWIQNSYYHFFTPNTTWFDCTDKYDGTHALITARSNHIGGVNVLFGDGSVAFKKNEINIQIWRALGTRTGGEAINIQNDQ